MMYYLKEKNFLKFLKAFPDSLYPALQNDRVFMAGGFLRSFFDGTQVMDFDVFFKDAEARDQVLKSLLDYGGKVIFSCPEGKLKSLKVGPWKVQLITERYYQDPEELIDTFDITASMFCFWNGDLYAGETSVRDAKNKNLRLNKVTFPAATFKRIQKYAAKGYTYPPSLVENFVVSTLASTQGIGPENAKEWNNLWRFYID